jgi:hypothetical protein
MADVIRGKHTEPTPTAAFDQATLVDGMVDELGAPIWPKNPVPTGEPVARTRQPRMRAGRPPGAEDLTPLFATGLVLLTTFAIGEWAAPTAEEAGAIGVPLANIMARRIDIAAKLGKDASDTIALAVALMAYSYRIVPLATERVRSSLEQRKNDRVSRAGLGGTDVAGQPPYSATPRSVVAGEGNGTGPGNGPAFDPLTAIAKVRASGLSIFDGNPDDAIGTHLPLADQR